MRNEQLKNEIFKITIYNMVFVAKSCLTLCNPRDSSPPGSSVHRVFQSRILEWVAISFSRESSLLRDPNQVFLHCRWSLYLQNT